jgi:hypothetical protein
LRDRAARRRRRADGDQPTEAEGVANLAGEPNRAAGKQELFGERRLARVGAGNNRKGPPLGARIMMFHADASLQGRP